MTSVRLPCESYSIAGDGHGSNTVSAEGFTRGRMKQGSLGLGDDKDAKMQSEIGHQKRHYSFFGHLGAAFIVAGTGLLTDAYVLWSWGPYNLFKWCLIAKNAGLQTLVCKCPGSVLYVVVKSLASVLYNARRSFPSSFNDIFVRILRLRSYLLALQSRGRVSIGLGYPIVYALVLG